MPKLTPTTIANTSLGFALALFLGRMLGETIFSGQPILTLGLTAVLSVMLMVSFRPLPFQQSWPLGILWLYVLWPTPRLDMRVMVGFTAVVALIFNQFNQPHAQQFLSQKRLLQAILLTIALLAPLSLYLLTLAPDLLPADNGEFQLVGATLGLAHPPGFPLYTLLAHAATWLPLPLTAGAKINLLSALLAVVTLALVALTSRQLSPRTPALTANTLIVIVALATSTTFWAQAVMANIRIPTALFATLAFYALLRFEQAIRQEKTATADHWLILFALTMSLGLTHHLSLAFMAVVMGLFVLWVDPRFLRMPKRWTRPCMAALLGLLPLLYLPLADPTLRQPAEFFSYALGLGFQGDFFYFHTPAQLWQRAGIMINIFTFQFQPLILLGAMGGFFLLLRHNLPRAFLLGGSLLLHTAVVATYRAPQAVEYMLPAYVPLVLLMGYSLSELSRYAKEWGVRPVGVLYAALLTTAVFTQLVTHWSSYRYLSQSQDTAVYTDQILTHAPPDSVVLANWHWVTPLWYEQAVNGRRPDLEIVYLYPQTADYGADWATRIERELAHGRAVVATFYEESSYQNLPPSQPLGEAFLFPNAPLLTLPPHFSPFPAPEAEAEFTIHGYHLDQHQLEMGQEATLTLAWTYVEELDEMAQALRRSAGEVLRVSFYAHLVNYEGQIVAQDDVTVYPQTDGLTLTQFRLTPRFGSHLGDHALFVGTIRPTGTRTQIDTITLQPQTFPPLTANPTYRTAATHGQTPPAVLVGYDWDNTFPPQPRLYLHWRLGNGQYMSEVQDLHGGEYALPEVTGVWGFSTNTAVLRNSGDTHYVPLGQGMVWWGSRPCLCTLSPLEPGQTVTIQQRFTASRPIQRDIGFSVRLLGFTEDNFSWQWRTPDSADSDIPALGGIPTLKWIAGSAIWHPRTLQIDPQAAPSRTVGGMVRPYDVFTNRPIPILDERIATSNQPWLPLEPGHVAGE